MSVKSNEDPSSEAEWFGDDLKIDRVGSNVAKLDNFDGEVKIWEDDTSEQKHFSHHPENNRQPLPVVMETASTDKSDPLQKSSDMDDLYTSLLSNQNYSFQPDSSSSSSSYFSGSGGGKSSSGGGVGGGGGGGGGLMDDLMSSLDSHAMFGSDSGIEMTPGDPSDTTSSSTRKTTDSEREIGGVGGSFGGGSGGITSDYNYMDISRPQQQQRHLGDEEEEDEEDEDDHDDWGGLSSGKPSDLLSGLGTMGSMAASSVSASSGGHAAGGYMEKGEDGTTTTTITSTSVAGVPSGAAAGMGGAMPGSREGLETLGPALDAQSFPYVEEPSDEELSDYQPYRSPGAGSSASPVKITLTETPPRSPSPSSLSPGAPGAPGGGAHVPPVSDRESILSLGLEGVPTVTLSEPEDESPGSSTPPLTEESDSPSDLKYKTSGSKSFTHDKSPTKQPSPSDKAPPHKSTSSAFPRSAHDAEGSSGGESGDSEIELVSEETGSAATAPATSSYMSFSKPSSVGPTPSFTSAPPPATSFTPSSATAATLNQYSILREEREAELDSELALESCGEESPKRGGRTHDSPAPRNLFSSSPSPVVPPSPPATHASFSPAFKAPAMEEMKHSPTPGAPVVSTPPKTIGSPLEKTSAAGEDASRHPSQTSSGPARQLPPLLQGLSKQKALELLYWRDVKQTGLLFGSVLLLLFSLTQFSVVSVVAYLALAALSATISFRIYKSVLQAVQKTDEGHPFKAYLDMEIALSQDQMQRYAENVQHYLNSMLKELRRLFLVQDLVDSLKFAVLMWLLTYVGALFNGLTLLIMAVVSLFSMPVVYEKYQPQIDQYIGLVRTQVNSVVGKIQEKIPGAKRKAE